MYRIYDKPEAIKRVQKYLAIISNPKIFVAPTGIYDQNTMLSVKDFQRTRGILDSGIVDYQTFTLLYKEYEYQSKINTIKEISDSFIDFPLLPGDLKDEMIHVNRSLRRLIEYYGFTSSLLNSNFYSKNTSDAVKILREIYSLPNKDLIDEKFYLRMMKDHDSIKKFQTNFN